MDCKIGGHTVHPKGGSFLSVEQAAQAMEEALELIRHFGWTSAEYQHKDAKAWMDRYFPNHPKNQQSISQCPSIEVGGGAPDAECLLLGSRLFRKHRDVFQ